MNKAIKRKWVKALLSGEYVQTRGRMKAGDKYCCLGVLRDCMGWKDADKSILTSGELIASGLEETHNRDSLDSFGRDFCQQRLSSLNDFGVPFDMIAGLIDEAL